MEKEFSSFSELENKIETLIDLLLKLKEDNHKLLDENRHLLNKCQDYEAGDGLNISDTKLRTEEKTITADQAVVINKHVKNALDQLDQLRQSVANGRSQ